MKKMLVVLFLFILPLNQLAFAAENTLPSSEITPGEQDAIDEFIRTEWEEELHLIRVNSNNMYLDADPEDVNYSDSYRIWIFDSSLDGFEGRISDYTFTKSEMWVDTGHSVYLTFTDENGKLEPGAVYGTRPTTPVIRVDELKELLDLTLGENRYHFCFVMMEPLLMKIAVVLDDQGNEWVYPYSKMLKEYELPESELIDSNEFIAKTSAYWKAIREQQPSVGEPVAGGPISGSNTWVPLGLLTIFGFAACAGIIAIALKKPEGHS